MAHSLAQPSFSFSVAGMGAIAGSSRCSRTRGQGGQHCDELAKSTRRRQRGASQPVSFFFFFFFPTALRSFSFGDSPISPVVPDRFSARAPKRLLAVLSGCCFQGETRIPALVCALVLKGADLVTAHTYHKCSQGSKRGRKEKEGTASFWILQVHGTHPQPQPQPQAQPGVGGEA